MLLSYTDIKTLTSIEKLTQTYLTHLHRYKKGKLAHFLYELDYKNFQLR